MADREGLTRGSTSRRRIGGSVRSDLIARSTSVLVGWMAITAVIVAVNEFGWWSLPFGVLAMAPGALFIVAGVLGDG